MNRANRKLLRLFQIVGLCLFVAGCQTGVVVEQAAVPVALVNNTLETSIEDAFPGFTPWRGDQNEAMSNAGKFPGHVKGDFNGDNLMDEALLLSKPQEWKLAVFLQESAGNYSVKEITTFPGKDSEWRAIPIEKIHLDTISAAEPEADRLGLEVAGRSGRLEYSWQEKTRSFAASQIRDSASIGNSASMENRQETESANAGVVTLFAQESKSDQESASYLDIDNQSTDDKPGADLLFTSGTGTMTFYTLDPLGKTKAMSFGQSTPDYDDCLTQQDLMSDGATPQIAQGMNFCVKTDQENIARVWIEGLDLDDHSITLGYQVWPSNH